MRVAVIPARGGSKRVPRKNIREFNGRPIITYSIEAAAASGCFSRIVVSTDDAEIADVARASGAEVPFLRPVDLADDHTPTVPVVRHALESLAADAPGPSHVCCIYATAPFLTADAITSGFTALEESGAGFSLSVAAYPSPVQRALRIRDDGRVEPLAPEYALTRSQDLEPAYFDAGQFYWGTASAWMGDVPIHASRAVAVVLPAYLAVDIDTLDDWERAEYMYTSLQQAGKL